MPSAARGRSYQSSEPWPMIGLLPERVNCASGKANRNAVKQAVSIAMPPMRQDRRSITAHLLSILEHRCARSDNPRQSLVRQFDTSHWSPIMGRRASSFLFRLLRLSPVALCLLTLTRRGLLPSHASAPSHRQAPTHRMLAFSISGERGRMRGSSHGRGTSPLRGRTCSTSTCSCRSRAPRTRRCFLHRANLESYGFLYPDNYETRNPPGGRPTSGACPSAW